MTTQNTYQGETLTELNSQLNYAVYALTHKLENWEAKEFETLKKECEFKINAILENN